MSRVHKEKFKSPMHKLAAHFKTARDGWRAKHHELQHALKLARNQIRAVEKSRDQWRQRAERVESSQGDESCPWVEELEALRRENGRLRRQVMAPWSEKKNSTVRATNLEDGTEEPVVEKSMVENIGIRSWFSPALILTGISLVVLRCLSLRGAQSALEAWHWAGLAKRTPGYVTLRTWALRLGLYKLRRRKEHARDWFFIVDHTIQLGVAKCLVVLGVRLSRLSATSMTVHHTMLEPLRISPMQKSTWENVYEELHQAAACVGSPPRGILHDGARELIRATEEFARQHPETASIRDIHHTAANALKKAAAQDRGFAYLMEAITNFRLSVQQTALAFLAPPNLRRYARFMNIDTITAWLRGYALPAASHISTLVEAFKQPKTYVAQKLAWVRDHRVTIERWLQFDKVVALIRAQVQKQGYSQATVKELRATLHPRHLHTLAPSVQELATELLDFVAEQSRPAGSQERLIGSTDIIESVFGKHKHLQGEQARSGFTASLLYIPALVGEINLPMVRQAFAEVHERDVRRWSNEHLGTTVQSARRKWLILRKSLERKGRKVA